MFDAIRRNVRQQLEAKADPEYRKMLALLIDPFRNPVKEQMQKKIYESTSVSC